MEKECKYLLKIENFFSLLLWYLQIQCFITFCYFFFFPSYTVPFLNWSNKCFPFLYFPNDQRLSDFQQNRFLLNAHHSSCADRNTFTALLTFILYKKNPSQTQNWFEAERSLGYYLQSTPLYHRLIYWLFTSLENWSASISYSPPSGMALKPHECHKSPSLIILNIFPCNLLYNNISKNTVQGFKFFFSILILKKFCFEILYTALKRLNHNNWGLPRGNYLSKYLTLTVQIIQLK